MAKTSRSASALLAVTALLSACLSGARAPDVPPSGTLAPGDDAALAAAGGAFGVVFATPKGATDDPSEITIVFNRPMRPLDLAGDEAPAPATITPAVKGRWGWMGTTAIQFVPEDHLPRATDYAVEVPATTRALDGSTLGKPYRFKFSTARPALVSVDAPGEHRALEPGVRFSLRFNQPVTDAEVTRAVALQVGDRAARFDLERPDAQNAQLVELTPKQKLPLDTSITITAKADLHGAEGPLASGKEATFEFQTYGPLTVTGVACSTETPNRRCAVDGGFTIELSNRVKVSDVKKSLRIEPPVKIRWPGYYGDEAVVASISVAARFSPGRSYTVSLGGGLRDEHGQRLASSWSHRVDFDDLWPTAEIGLMGALFEPAARRAIPVASVNVKGFELATARLDEAAVLALAADEGRRGGRLDVDFVKKLPGAAARAVPPTA
ncbi:MAG TPA: Ig-like domain-containing protein, partial [Minicystis sp.]|nr:Ig-like domain-containing protein [Minicystis sp.]